MYIFHSTELHYSLPCYMAQVYVYNTVLNHRKRGSNVFRSFIDLNAKWWAHSKFISSNLFSFDVFWHANTKYINVRMCASYWGLYSVFCMHMTHDKKSKCRIQFYRAPPTNPKRSAIHVRSTFDFIIWFWGRNRLVRTVA